MEHGRKNHYVYDVSLNWFIFSVCVKEEAVFLFFCFFLYFCLFADVVLLALLVSFSTFLQFQLLVFSMFAEIGILESAVTREPWNDVSRPIYERLHLKREAQKKGEISDTLLEQLSSQRDATSEAAEDQEEQRERRSSTKNFFSGMDLDDLEGKVEKMKSMA